MIKRFIHRTVKSANIRLSKPILLADQLIYKEIENVPEDFIMSKAMFIEEAPELEVGIAKIPESFREKYHLVRSTPFYLEILNRDASKGNAVKELSEKLGIKQSEVICIGDQENDVTMLEFAGLGIAMGNAPERIKQLADYTTASNNDSGVAKAIQKFVLDK